MVTNLQVRIKIRCSDIKEINNIVEKYINLSK
jgi:hypothetical protein